MSHSQTVGPALTKSSLTEEVVNSELVIQPIHYNIQLQSALPQRWRVQFALCFTLVAVRARQYLSRLLPAAARPAPVLEPSAPRGALCRQAQVR